MREADLYEKVNGEVVCKACSRKCRIPNGLHGFCGVRYNKNGKLIVGNYGLFISVALDPIEKKPFYHFYPGHKALSFGTTGCSWGCKFCINYDISHRKKLIGYEISLEEILELCSRYNTKIVTFTYNEPSIYMEFSKDLYEIAKNKDIKITWVSNGYLTEESRKYASKFLDAIVIDVKGSGDPEFLKKFCLVPDPSPIFETIEYMYKRGVHVEVTDLIVTKYGDSEKYFRNLVEFIVNLSDEIPLHILRFFPEYKVLDVEPTPLDTLEKFYRIAKEEGLKYVYIGNVPSKYENTYCPNCGKEVIKRRGFLVYEVNVDDKNKCIFCGEKINIKGNAKLSEIVYPEPVFLNKNLKVRKI